MVRAHAVVVGVLVLCAVRASAVGGTLSDQAVSLTYPATHFGGQPAADLTGVDATGDPLAEVGYWYRAEGDTRELPLPAPDSESYSGGDLVAVWNNLHGKGFRVEERTSLYDHERPSGGFVSHLVVKNDNPVPKLFWVFHYLDPELGASSASDTGTLVNTRFLKFAQGASRLAYRAGQGTKYQVGAQPTLRNALNDASVTTLNDTGLPFAAGNVSAAFEFGPYDIPAGSSFVIGLVSVMFNPARDRVKGDYQNLGQAMLFAEPAAGGTRGVVPMRRASQITSGALTIAAPLTSARLVGVDDFDADFRSEPVYRDMTTGTAYVSLTAISGAPTLALNWKLSTTGDFDADGKADILWRNTVTQKLVIWTMDGAAKTGNITPSPDQAVDANWEVAAAADFNGDGTRDLLWYNQTSGKIVLWHMNASVVRTSGVFTNPASVGNNNWVVRAVGDYGRGAGGVYDAQDIVWQNSTSKKIVIWHMDKAANRTSGVFSSPDTLFGSWDLAGPR
jgi:FG-GAP-like repeat